MIEITSFPFFLKKLFGARCSLFLFCLNWNMQGRFGILFFCVIISWLTSAEAFHTSATRWRMTAVVRNICKSWVGTGKGWDGVWDVSRVSSDLLALRSHGSKLIVSKLYRQNVFPNCVPILRRFCPRFTPEYCGFGNCATIFRISCDFSKGLRAINLNCSKYGRHSFWTGAASIAADGYSESAYHVTRKVKMKPHQRTGFKNLRVTEKLYRLKLWSEGCFRALWCLLLATAQPVHIIDNVTIHNIICYGADNDKPMTVITQNRIQKLCF